MIKDPPAGWGPASSIYITFNHIWIHRTEANGESGWFDTGVNVVNLSLREVVIFDKMIGEVSLQAGSYNIVRFNVTQAIVTVEGINYTCRIEHGNLHVPIINGGLYINALQTTHLEIDISPKVTGKVDSFKLTPAARAVPLSSTEDQSWTPIN